MSGSPDIPDAPLADPGLTFADIMRDTGLDRDVVRAMLAHLGVEWAFDGHSNRVDREAYLKVRGDLRSIIPALQARDLALSKKAPARRRPRARATA